MRRVCGYAPAIVFLAWGVFAQLADHPLASSAVPVWMVLVAVALVLMVRELHRRYNGD